jgi:Protein of unknown function (DUF1064)
MMRYRQSDLGRLGEQAREQIRLATLAADMQARMQQPVPPASKFGNRRVEFDGHSFDSLAECNRYVDLKRLHRAGFISELIVHPVFRLEVAGVLVCRYEADFSFHGEDGGLTVEDVKSPVTAKHPVYRLKKRLMQACHGITITEILT